MAFADRPRVQYLRELAENRLGIVVESASELERLHSMEAEFGEFRQDAEELAVQSMDYFGGRPSEMRPDRRRNLAQKSRIALMQDPLAGAEAELLSNFGFGKGLSIPSARNSDVQDVIDSAWTDPINEQLLTGYMAQRKLSNELLSAGELFVTLYVGGGKIRVGKLDADRVRTIVPDPENRNIPLFYVYSEPSKVVWDYGRDAPDPQPVSAQQKTRYYPHWRNVEDALTDRDRIGVEDDEEALVMPPPDKLASGLVYHVAINQTGEQLRGNPPWARSLRFFTAMNVLTAAHVTQAQAATAFIARRAMKGSPRQITRAAASVLTAAGELGAAAFRPAAGFGIAGNAEPTTEPFTGPGMPGPFPPGSWWNENESSTLSPLNLNSGSAQMSQTAQIVRAPIAASSGFGQHYLGDAQNGNLATASTLELPATMRVGAWQEFFEQMYRWFTDRAIEAAVHAGLLGGSTALGSKPLAEMRLHEAEDRAEMEARTNKDLSYEFSMPFPGRRQMTDVTTFVTQLSTSMDPNGVNVPLRRMLLKFAIDQIGIDDVARAVEECIPENGMPGGIGPQAGPNFASAAAKQTAAGQPPPGGSADPAEGAQPYGANAGTAAGGGSAGPDGTMESAFMALEAEWLTPEARKLVDEMNGRAGKMLRSLVLDPAVVGSLDLATA
jgi:hypothetical protein